MKGPYSIEGVAILRMPYFGRKFFRFLEEPNTNNKWFQANKGRYEKEASGLAYINSYLPWATGTSVLTDPYKKIGEERDSVDLNMLWKQLGVRSVDGSIVFDNHVPLAAIRQKISSPDLHPVDTRNIVDQSSRRNFRFAPGSTGQGSRQRHGIDAG